MRSLVNYRYYQKGVLSQPQRTPRLPADFGKKFIRNLGQSSRSIFAPNGSHGEILRAAQSALGTLRPWKSVKLLCESYLIAATATWIHDRVENRLTYDRYFACFRAWVAMSGLRRLDWQCQVTPRFLSGWADDLEEQGYAPRTINTNLQILRSWYAWLRDIGMIERTPWRHDLLRKVDRLRLYHANRVGHVRRVLTPEQAQSLVDHAWAQPAARRCALILMICLGLRRREVVEVRREDLYADNHGRYLSVQGKGRRTRSLLLDPVAAAAIDLVLVPDGPGRPPTKGLLLVGSGEGYHVETISYWLKVAGHSIGRPDLTPHELRRTHATIIRDRGASLESTQLALGHASAATTQTHYDIGDRRWRDGTGLTVPKNKASA